MLELQATDKTPLVHFDPGTGMLELAGIAVHENADAFFAPIMAEIERYALAPAQNTTVRIELEYFNSSAAKYLLDMLRTLEDLHLAGSSSVGLEWVHAADDLDMQEAGQDFKFLLEFPTKVVARR